jgi:dTDP-4-dehydrorhamnose 3,5-epimerase
MRTTPCRLDGLTIIEPAVHGDERGFFTETYRRAWHESASIPSAEEFIQDNHSRSSHGVVRGMHFHVDLRRGSPTYGQWEGVELDGETLRELYVPVGFAHGFCVLSDVADVLYKQTAYYDPAVERGIAWNDPDIAIQWPFPIAELIVSERDSAAPRLREVADELPFVYGAS